MNETEVFWAVASKAIRAAPIAGGGPRDVTTTGFVDKFVVAGATIFYIDGEKVMSVPTAGGTPKLVSATSATAKSIAADTAAVYWANPRGTIQAIAR